MSAEKSNVEIRQFDSSDIDKIITLLNEVHKADFTRDWWKWKYEHNPSGFNGSEGDICVAESEGKIVAHWAIMPEKLRFRSKTLNIAQAVDAATHPAYRRMGLFSTMMKNVFSKAKKRYRFVVGFPTNISYKGSLKYGWRSLSPLPVHIKILNYNSYFRRYYGDYISGRIRKSLYRASSQIACYSRKVFSSKTAQKRVKIERIESFGDEINTFWERVGAYYGAILERTDAFLNWRFSKKFKSYNILLARSSKDDVVGYVVSRSTVDTVVIVDLVTLPNEGDAVSQLIDAAVAEGLTPSVDCVQLCFPRWHENEAILSRKGFTSPVRPILKKVYFPQFIYFNLQEGQPVPSAGEWFFTYADTDFM
jgi:predicted acetyltransferase